MPGLIVAAALPLRFTDACRLRPRLPAIGTARPAKGSGRDAIPVVGAGAMVAFPLVLTPPTTWMVLAVTWALPLTVNAVLEVESITTFPNVEIAALPETDNAPLTLGSSSRN